LAPAPAPFHSNLPQICAFDYPFVPGDQNEGRIYMKTLVLKFLNNESGATAIEYGLIAAGIAIAIITAVQGVGTALNTNFGTISTSLK
jgi:pilus assembly protein Flp/PilA